MATVRQDYVVRFRVINMATGELANLASQFAPVFGSMGKTIQTFVSAAGAAFLTWGSSAVAILGGLWLAWKALGIAIGVVKAALKGVVQLFRDSINIGTKFQNTITLVSVAANQSAEAFSDIAIAASSVGVSTLKAARGFETMIRSGLTGREALVVFKDLALFSRAIGERMSATASVMVGAMRAFQIEAKDASRVLSVFSFAILKTRFNFATFSTAFAFGGAAAAGFGRDLEETVAVMARLFNMGLRASTVGTTLRNMLTRLANPTEKARIALLRYGITLEKLNPLTNRWSELLVNLRPLVGQLGDLTQIFGRRTAGFISRLLQQVDPAGKFIEDLATKIEKTTVLVDDVMRRRLNTAAGQLEIFVAQWEAAKVQLFNIIEPIITELFFAFNQSLFSIRETIKNVTPSLSRILVDAFKIVRSVGGQLEATLEFVVNAMFGFLPAILEAIPQVNRFFHEVFGLTGAMSSLEKVVNTVSILMQGLTLAMKAPVAVIRGFKKSEIQASADAIVALARAFEFLGLKLPVVEDAGTLEALLKPDKAKQQLDILNQQVRDAMKKVSDTFERESKLINKKQSALFTLETARILDQTSRALIEEGGPFGTFTKRIAEVGAKNGATFAEALQDAAFAVFQQEGNLKEIFKRLADAREKAILERGPTLGITTTQLATSLKAVDKFGIQMANRVGEIFGSQREFAITALVGLDAPQRARQIVTKKFGEVFGDDLFDRLFEAAETEIFGMSEEETKKILAEFIKRTKQMRRFAKDTLQNFKAVDTIVERLGTSLRIFDKAAVEGLVKAIEKTKLEEGAESAKKLGSEWQRIGKEASNLVLAGIKVNKVVGAGFLESVNKFIAAKDKVGLAKFSTEMKLVTESTRENGKAVNAIVNKAYIPFLSTVTMLPAPFGIFGTMVQKMTNETLPKHAEFVVKNKVAYKLWEKEIKKFPSTWLTMQALLKGGPISPEDIDMQTAMFFNAWERSLDRTIQIHRARASLAQKIWNARLAGMGRRQREMVQTVVQSTKALMSGLASSLATSSSKISDVFKRFIDTIKAKLLELMVVKPLLKGILSPVMGIFGGAGKGIINQIFGGGIGGGGIAGLVATAQYTAPIAAQAGALGQAATRVLGPVPNVGGFGFSGSLTQAQGTRFFGAGSDRIPALLRPGELVFDTDASDVLRQQMMGGGMGRAMQITINAMDGADVKRVFENQIVPMMKGQLKNNQGISSDVAIRSNRSVRSRRFR